MAERPIVKFVIFDCDGVLVDSEIPMHEVLTTELNALGVEISFEQCLRTFMGLSIEGVLDRARALGANLHDNWKADLYAKVYKRLEQGVDVIPGVKDLIARLEANGVSYCVASNGSEKKMEIMLSQHGLWEKFSGRCYSAQTLGVAKPDPRLLQHALDAHNFRADEALIIEDSLTGLAAARNANVRCLLYQPRDFNHSDTDLIKTRFRHMNDIAAHIFGEENASTV